MREALAKALCVSSQTRAAHRMPRGNDAGISHNNYQIYRNTDAVFMSSLDCAQFLLLPALKSFATIN
jgi:hypothetical protein